jgi:hypothetical protein
VLLQQVKELIASHRDAMLVHKVPKQVVQFSSPYPGQVPAKADYLLQNQFILHALFFRSPELVIKCLSALTKQSTQPSQAPDSIVGLYKRYCLVPEFFLMATLSSFSARSIIVSRQMIFIRAS